MALQPPNILVARAIRTKRFTRIDSRESFAIEAPIFIARQADSPESLEFPIRANHATKPNIERPLQGREIRVTAAPGPPSTRSADFFLWGKKSPVRMILLFLQEIIWTKGATSIKECPPAGTGTKISSTKEYLNHKSTKIRVFRVCFRASFLPPFLHQSSPLSPHQAVSTLLPLFPSSPPPVCPL